jgi:anhydro-N-acetylmuramic acid kinase
MRVADYVVARLLAEGINRVFIVTGGGAKNIFLMECIKQHTQCQIIYPTEQIIEFKEALIFAFLGLLRVNQQANSLHLVTGASKDAIGGCVYLP